MTYSLKEYRVLLEKTFDSRKTDLPLFNKTVVSIMSELSKSEPDIRKLSRIILTDQSLTSQVLKVANSSFFRRLTKVSSIDDAVLRLGINWVANIVVLLTQREKIGSKNPDLRVFMETLWRHSVACGIGVLWVVEHKGLTALKPEAFIAGLLHDEGKLLVLVLIDQLYRKGGTDGPLPDDTVRILMDQLHTDFGYELMRSWNIPDQYALVARDHHIDDFDREDTLLTVVRLVDRTCNGQGIGLAEEHAVDLAVLPENETLDLAYESFVDLQQALRDASILSKAPSALRNDRQTQRGVTRHSSASSGRERGNRQQGVGTSEKASNSARVKNVDLTAVLTIYHSMLKTIRETIVAAIGRKGYAVFETAKPSAGTAGCELLQSYAINKPVSTNINEVTDFLESRHKGGEQLDFAVKCFSAYTDRVLKKSASDLDRATIREVIAVLNKQLPYFKTFITDSLKPYKIIETTQSSLVRLERAVNERKGK